MATPILLLVWHRLFENIIYDDRRVKFWKVFWCDYNKDLNMLFSWRMSYNAFWQLVHQRNELIYISLLKNSSLIYHRRAQFSCITTMSQWSPLSRVLTVTLEALNQERWSLRGITSWSCSSFLQLSWFTVMQWLSTCCGSVQNNLPGWHNMMG